MLCMYFRLIREYFNSCENITKVFCNSKVRFLRNFAEKLQTLYVLTVDEQLLQLKNYMNHSVTKKLR